MFWLLLTLSMIKFGACLDNGLSITPPMGWMWGSFFCKPQCSANANSEDCISDYVIRRKADKLKAEGYVAAGYKYIVIDSCWLDERRDDKGNLRAHTTRFPNGIKPIADYLHKLGMKLGLSVSLGASTCAGRFEGSHGHYEQDAMTLASWGVDMVKAHGCFMDLSELDEAFVMMGFALNSTGRHMDYLCNWPSILMRNSKPVSWSLVSSSCNMWDVKDSPIDTWSGLMKLLHYFYHHNKTIGHIAGKGAWHYAGPMKIDSHLIDGNMSLTHMAIYAVMGFPLFLKGPLTHITETKAKILKDPILHSIHQDALGHAGYRIPGHFYNGIQIYVRQLVKGRIVAVFVNTNLADSIYSSYPLRAFLPFFPGADDETRLSIHDVFNKSEQSLPFKAMLEVKHFHPASCLVVIMKVGDAKAQRQEWVEPDLPVEPYALNYSG